MGQQAPTATATSELAAEVEKLPVPFFDELLWIASCRQTDSMSQFSSRFIMYMPDCRPFCDKGESCKRLLRDEADHINSFMHVSRDVLKAAAAADIQLRGPTAVVNRAALKDVFLPYASRCWLIPSHPPHADNVATTTSSDMLLSFPEALDRRQVVLFVHGFRYKAPRVMKTCLSLRQCEMLSNATVLAFVWPSHKGKQSYPKARRKAAEAADFLKILLQLLHDLQSTVFILAHSLGCRVALAALRDNEAKVRYLALTGAALPRGALLSGEEFDRRRLAVEHIDILYSQQDSVLRKYFWLGEAAHAWLSSAERPSDDALGLSGPIARLPGTTALDVSSQVPSHSAVHYLLAPLTLQRLQQHMQVSLGTGTYTSAGADSCFTSQGSACEGDVARRALEEESESADEEGDSSD